MSTLAALAAMLLLFTATLYCWVVHWPIQWQKSEANYKPASHHQIVPVSPNALYEQVVRARTDQEQEMELKQNEAYEPLRP